MRKDTRKSNLGKVFEDLLRYINNLYRARKEAVISKVPTEWIPIRDDQGRIVSAKVENKSPVDFLGCYQGWAIAYDCKSTKDTRIRWDVVEDHQAEFLNDWMASGGVSFILVEFSTTGQMFVVPWEFWRSHLNNWKGKLIRDASISFAELPGAWKVGGQSYLETMIGVFLPQIQVRTKRFLETRRDQGGNVMGT